MSTRIRRSVKPSGNWSATHRPPLLWAAPDRLRDLERVVCWECSLDGAREQRVFTNFRGSGVDSRCGEAHRVLVVVAVAVSALQQVCASPLPRAGVGRRRLRRRRRRLRCSRALVPISPGRGGRRAGVVISPPAMRCSTWLPAADHCCRPCCSFHRSALFDGKLLSVLCLARAGRRTTCNAPTSTCSSDFDAGWPRGRANSSVKPAPRRF